MSMPHTPTNTARILIVESDSSMREALAHTFVFHGYTTVTVANGDDALNSVLASDFELVIFDAALRDMDGFRVCERIRGSHPELPVVMLTSTDVNDDVISRLSLGADDYLTKPFSIRELVIRVQSLLAAGLHAQHPEKMTIGAREIDCVNLCGTSLRDDSLLRFTRREISVLAFLFGNESRASSRRELLEHVWGYDQAITLDTRTVDIHIGLLQRKLEPVPAKPRYIVAEPGKGYRLYSGGNR